MQLAKTPQEWESKIIQGACDKRAAMDDLHDKVTPRAFAQETSIQACRDVMITQVPCSSSSVAVYNWNKHGFAPFNVNSAATEAAVLASHTALVFEMLPDVPVDITGVEPPVKDVYDKVSEVFFNYLFGFKKDERDQRPRLRRKLVMRHLIQIEAHGRSDNPASALRKFAELLAKIGLSHWQVSTAALMRAAIKIAIKTVGQLSESPYTETRRTTDGNVVSSENNAYNTNTRKYLNNQNDSPNLSSSIRPLLNERTFCRHGCHLALPTRIDGHR